MASQAVATRWYCATSTSQSGHSQLEREQGCTALVKSNRTVAIKSHRQSVPRLCGQLKKIRWSVPAEVLLFTTLRYIFSVQCQRC